jgi:hypothetical protein
MFFNPLMQLGLERSIFFANLPLQERSKLPHLLLDMSSVFFSMKDNIHGHLL